MEGYMNNTILAGSGKVDITCRDKGVWKDLLSEKVKKHIPKEYLEKEIAVDDPLFARALALDDGNEKVVLITMDVTAIGARTISQNILSDSADDFMPKLRGRLERDFNIPGGNVSVCASHTHQVPRMLCSDEEQINKVAEAVKLAIDSMEPVTVGIGSGKEDRLTFNRTMMMKDGTDYTLRSCNPPPPDNEVEALRPVDPEIGIIRVDRLDGSPLAVVYDFGCHLLLGSPKGTGGHITADHVGVTLKYLEERIGGNVTALFIQGAGGDIAEVNKCDIEQTRGSAEFGEKLGKSILEGYGKITTGPTNLKVVTKNAEFPFRTDIPDIIASLKQEQAEMQASLRYTSLDFKAFLPLYLKYKLHPEYPSHWAYRYLQARDCGNRDFEKMDERNKVAVEKYLDSLHKMEMMARNEEKIATLTKHQEIIGEIGTATVPAEIKGIKVGECVLITAPMEVLSEVGFNVKKISPFKYTYIVSIANGYLHYSPPASYYPRGGYEVTECLLAPEWEKVFMKTVENIFREL